MYLTANLIRAFRWWGRSDGAGFFFAYLANFDDFNTRSTVEYDTFESNAIAIDSDDNFFTIASLKIHRICHFLSFCGRPRFEDAGGAFLLTRKLRMAFSLRLSVFAIVTGYVGYTLRVCIFSVGYIIRWST
jgi:hypothetical protein